MARQAMNRSETTGSWELFSDEAIYVSDAFVFILELFDST